MSDFIRRYIVRVETLHDIDGSSSGTHFVIKAPWGVVTLALFGLWLAAWLVRAVS